MAMAIHGLNCTTLVGLHWPIIWSRRIAVLAEIIVAELVTNWLRVWLAGVWQSTAEMIVAEVGIEYCGRVSRGCFTNVLFAAEWVMEHTHHLTLMLHRSAMAQKSGTTVLIGSTWVPLRIRSLANHWRKYLAGIGIQDTQVWRCCWLRGSSTLVGVMVYCQIWPRGRHC